MLRSAAVSCKVVNSLVLTCVLAVILIISFANRNTTSTCTSCEKSESKRPTGNDLQIVSEGRGAVLSGVAECGAKGTRFPEAFRNDGFVSALVNMTLSRWLEIEHPMQRWLRTGTVFNVSFHNRMRNRHIAYATHDPRQVL